MSMDTTPVVVVQDGLTVRCVDCGAVWAGPFNSEAVAARVAGEMNGDPTYAPPSFTRSGLGRCCSAGGRVTHGYTSPADWRERLVAPRPARPLGDGDRPAWATAALVGAGVLSAAGRAPGVLLALVAQFAAAGAVLVGVAWLVLRDASQSMAGLLVSITLVGLVGAVVAGSVWFITTTHRTGEDTSGESLEERFLPVGHVGDRVKR